MKTGNMDKERADVKYEYSGTFFPRSTGLLLLQIYFLFSYAPHKMESKGKPKI